MSLMASLKQMRYARKGPGNLLGKAAFYSCLLTACAGVWGLALGICRRHDPPAGGRPADVRLPLSDDTE